MHALRKFSALILLAAFCLFSSSLFAKNELNWNKEANKITADIENWQLQPLLEKISKTAGWEIYVEPGSKRDVSVKFKDLPVEDGLKRLLGNLNYALIPQTNAAPKFYVFHTTISKATELVSDAAPEKKKERSKHLIPNELIVTLVPDADMSIEELARMLGAKITGRSDALRTYRLEFASEADANAALEKLKGNDDISSIDHNYFFDPQPPPLGAQISSSAQFNLTPTAVGDPNNLVVALIDTGVQQLGDDMKGFVLPEISIVDGDPGDKLSHGTSMVQSLLQGMMLAEGQATTSRVKILPVDVYGNRVNTSTYDVALGVYQAVNKGATVVNMSLGSSGDSDFLRRIILSASQQGVLFFAAAGNEPTTAAMFPAAYPEVIAVTAVDREGNLAPYANRGSFVDIAVPGATLVKFNQKSYLVGGTSVASAAATGMAAGTADTSGKSLAEISAIIRSGFAFRTK